MKFRFFLCLLLAVYVAAAVRAQVPGPVRWHFATAPINDNEAKLIFTADLEEGWHLYSQYMEEDGPLPTAFSFNPDAGYTLIGKVNEESTPVKHYDDTFMMEIAWFDRTAVFSQHIRSLTQSTVVKGKIEFMACNNEMCLPPDEVTFIIHVKSQQPVKGQAVGYEKSRKD
jgi:hypothetical protein